MHTSTAAVRLLPLLLALVACGSPPQPPTVDGSKRRPANTRSVVDLQRCKTELQNTHLAALQGEREARVAAATLARVAALQRMTSTATPPAGANSIYTVHFDFGSTRVTIPEEAAAPLIEAARAAPLVLLRGRTDGVGETPAQSRIARARAAAVLDYLVAAGVDASRIRATYQPVGDHVADNASTQGRSRNRRVEIELYRASPVVFGSTVALAR